MKSNNPKTWKALSENLGITPATLRAWRAEPDSPESKDLAAWQTWLDNRAPAQGQAETAGQSMAELKTQLMIERTKKERALAGLREIELRREQENLVPESLLVDRMIRTLSPLRRLLDSLPSYTAAIANPDNPQVAEIAIRQALDERVFSELVKIINRFESEDKEGKS